MRRRLRALALLLALLACLAVGWGGGVASASGQRFGDVPPTHWAYLPIEAIAEAGVTNGCGGGLYCPERPVTRAEMAAFLCRALGLPGC